MTTQPERPEGAQTFSAPLPRHLPVTREYVALIMGVGALQFTADHYSGGVTLFGISPHEAATILRDLAAKRVADFMESST